jgi:hypothetical protein
MFNYRMFLDFYTVPRATKLCLSLSEILITFNASLGNDSALRDGSKHYQGCASLIIHIPCILLGYCQLVVNWSGYKTVDCPSQTALINKCHLDNDNLFRESHVTYTNNTSTKDFGKIVPCSSPSTCPAPSQCPSVLNRHIPGSNHPTSV